MWRTVVAGRRAMLASFVRRAVLPRPGLRTALLVPRRCCAAAVGRRGDDATWPQRGGAEADGALRELNAELQRVHASFGTLLEDRRVYYREDVLAERLPMERTTIANALLRPANSTDAPLTTTLVRELRAAWVPALQRNVVGAATASLGTSAVQAFYTLLLSSALTRGDADVRLVLQEMTSHEQLTPCASIYRAILLSLPFLYLVPVSPQRREWRLHRRELGEAASYYLGHALAQCRRDENKFDLNDVWDCFFVDATLSQMAPKLMDLWWDRFLRHDATAALPYTSVHALLTWAAAQRDVERAMRIFHVANERGVWLPGPKPVHTAPGALTTPHAQQTDLDAKALQQCQVRLLAKLLSTVKSLRADGGVRALVVRDLQRLIDPAVLQTLPWGVVNDVLSGLSMPSAMRLLKFCAAARAEGEAGVPFLLWASLLRRCARDHLVDEAESVFRFIRARFAWSAREKAELVEIMMRMYATLPVPDYASAMSTFLEHVIRHPGNEPVLTPSGILYQLLVRAGDSRNAAMMTFLEGCAAGAELSEESFEALLGANPYAAVAALSSKLPHDYAPSKLDAQLRLPANVDAHLRREEALRARGKPLYDSTGEAIG